MTTQANQPQQKENRDFGLPQAEFKPIAAEGGKWFKITAIVAGLVLTIGAGVIYWFFYLSPSSTDLSMGARPTPEKYESGAQRADAYAIDDNIPAGYQPTEPGAKKSTPDKKLETLKREEDTTHSSVPQAPQRTTGTVTSINTPRGCYYVVVGSFIDDDLASDYAHQLAQKGIEVMLIAPRQGQYYSQVAIKQENTFRHAYEKAEVLKSVYGTDIWVMKY